MGAPDDCGVPIGTPIELRLDRYVLPSTVSGRSISVFTESKDIPQLGISVASTYDVVERVVTFRPYSQPLPGVVYQVELTLPDHDPYGFGLRAFDGSPLEKGPVPLKWSFRTSRVAAAAVAPAEPPSCEGAVRILGRGGCAQCHTGSTSAPFGLSLDSTRGLAETAIARIAHEASTWAIPGSAPNQAARFGTGMSVIDPGSPSTSYLVYKLLENPGNFGPDGGCATAYRVPLPKGECLVASTSERARLADWFVAGDPMPPGHAALPGGITDLQQLASFIQSSTAQCQ